MNLFHYIDDAEIEERAYEYLLSLCDSAEMLYACNRDELDGLEITALGTKCEGLISAITGVRRGESWGMPGRIYKFALTDEVKRIIREISLCCELPVIDEIYLRLENLTLYSGDKVMYSVCSHEGYTDIDDGFVKKVSDFCQGEIVKTKRYAEAFEKYKKLPKRSRGEMAVIRSKLYDLNSQVEDAWGKWFRAKPRWENLLYEEYLELAKPVFSEDLYEKLAKAGSYKGLKPDGFPQTFEESLKFKGTENFCETELVREINRQLDMLETVFYIEEGLDDWHIDGEKERTPTMIMNTERKE